MCEKCVVRANKLLVMSDAAVELKHELMSAIDSNRCPFHPTYKCIRHPRKTKKFPRGCPICLALFKLRG
jgi:hypothetical protein